MAGIPVIRPPMLQVESASGASDAQQRGPRYSMTDAPLQVEQRSQFSKGLSAGTDQLQGSGYGFLALLGSSLGIPELRDYGLANAERNEREAASANVRVQSLADIDDFGDALDWAGAALGQAVPSLATAIAGGGAGALIGRALAKKAVTSLVAQGIERKVAERAITGAMANTATRRLMMRAVKTGVARGGIAGAATGGFAASAIPQQGSLFTELVGAGVSDEDAAPFAWGIGAVQGGLDLIPQIMAAKKIFGKPLNDQLSKSLLRGIAKTTATQAAAEGITEGTQEALSVFARLQTDPNFKLDGAAYQRIIDGAAAGALVGAALGGGTGSIAQIRARSTSERQRRGAAPPAAERSAPPGQAAPPAPPAAGPAAGPQQSPPGAPPAPQAGPAPGPAPQQSPTPAAPAPAAGPEAAPPTRDAPSAEPEGDLRAQLGDLVDESNPRKAVFLSAANLEANAELLASPELKGFAKIPDADGRGGVLVMKLRDAAQFREALRAGESRESIIGRLTRSGTAKPATDNPAVVQQKDEAGNVTAETVVDANDPASVEQAAAEYQQEGRTVEVNDPRDVLARREAGTQPEQAAPQPSLAEMQAKARELQELLRQFNPEPASEQRAPAPQPLSSPEVAERAAPPEPAAVADTRTAEQSVAAPADATAAAVAEYKQLVEEENEDEYVVRAQDRMQEEESNLDAGGPYSAWTLAAMAQDFGRWSPEPGGFQDNLTDTTDWYLLPPDQRKRLMRIFSQLDARDSEEFVPQAPIPTGPLADYRAVAPPDWYKPVELDPRLRDKYTEALSNVESASDWGKVLSAYTAELATLNAATPAPPVELTDYRAMSGDQFGEWLASGPALLDRDFDTEEDRQARSEFLDWLADAPRPIKQAYKQFKAGKRPRIAGDTSGGDVMFDEIDDLITDLNPEDAQQLQQLDPALRDQIIDRLEQRVGEQKARAFDEEELQGAGLTESELRSQNIIGKHGWLHDTKRVLTKAQRAVKAPRYIEEGWSGDEAEEKAERVAGRLEAADPDAMYEHRELSVEEMKQRGLKPPESGKPAWFIFMVPKPTSEIHYSSTYGASLTRAGMVRVALSRGLARWNALPKKFKDWQGKQNRPQYGLSFIDSEKKQRTLAAREITILGAQIDPALRQISNANERQLRAFFQGVAVLWGREGADLEFTPALAEGAAKPKQLTDEQIDDEIAAANAEESNPARATARARGIRAKYRARAGRGSSVSILAWLSPNTVIGESNGKRLTLGKALMAGARSVSEQARLPAEQEKLDLEAQMDNLDKQLKFLAEQLDRNAKKPEAAALVQRYRAEQSKARLKVAEIRERLTEIDEAFLPIYNELKQERFEAAIFTGAPIAAKDRGSIERDAIAGRQMRQLQEVIKYIEKLRRTLSLTREARQALNRGRALVLAQIDQVSKRIGRVGFSMEEAEKEVQRQIAQEVAELTDIELNSPKLEIEDVRANEGRDYIQASLESEEKQVQRSARGAEMVSDSFTRDSKSSAIGTFAPASRSSAVRVSRSTAQRMAAQAPLVVPKSPEQARYELAAKAYQSDPGFRAFEGTLSRDEKQGKTLRGLYVMYNAARVQQGLPAVPVPDDFTSIPAETPSAATPTVDPTPPTAPAGTTDVSNARVVMRLSEDTDMQVEESTDVSVDFGREAALAARFNGVVTEMREILGLNSPLVVSDSITTLINLALARGDQTAAEVFYDKVLQRKSPPAGMHFRGTDGLTYVFLNPAFFQGFSSLTQAQQELRLGNAIKVLNHELGHAFFQQQYNTATDEQHAAMWAAFERDKAASKKSAMREFDSRGNPMSPWGQFEEWFADQVAAWAATDRVPRNAIEQFFRSLAIKLKALFDYTTSRYSIDESVAQFINESIAGRRDRAASRHLDSLGAANHVMFDEDNSLEEPPSRLKQLATQWRAFKARSPNLNAALDNLSGAALALHDTFTARLQARIRRMNIPAFTKIVSFFHQRPGDYGGFVFDQRVSNRFRNFQQDFDKIIGDMDAEQQAELLEQLRTERATDQLVAKDPANTPALREKAAQFRVFMRRLYDYQLEANLPIRAVENFFPQIADIMELQREDTVDTIFAAVKAAGRRESRDEIVQIVSNMSDDSFAVDFDPTKLKVDDVGGNVRAPFANSLRSRKLDPALRDIIRSIRDEQGRSRYYDKDLKSSIRRYMMQATRRAEFNRILGDNYWRTEKGIKEEAKFDPVRTLSALVADARMQGADDAQVELIYDAIDAFMGRYGRIKSEPLRKLVRSVAFYQNLRTLMLVTLSSVGEIATIFLRSGNFARTWQVIRENAREAGSKQSSLMKQLRAIGFAVDELDALAFNEFKEARDYNSRIDRGNELFFRTIGLTKWTNFMRGLSLAVSRDYIEQHAATYETDADSKRRLDELGLKPADVQAWVASGKRTYGQRGVTREDLRRSRVVQTPQGPNVEFTSDTDLTAEQIESIERVTGAMARMVGEMVVAPTAAMKPLWRSDERMMLVGQLGSFTYGFLDRVLSRVHYEVTRDGATTMQRAMPLIALAMMVPIVAMGMELRELLQYDMWGKQAPTDKMDGFKYLRTVIGRTGATGLAQLGFDAYDAASHGRSSVTALMGPTINQINGAFMDIAQADRTGRQLWKTTLQGAPIIGTFPGFRDALVPE